MDRKTDGRIEDGGVFLFFFEEEDKENEGEASKIRQQ